MFSHYLIRAIPVSLLAVLIQSSSAPAPAQAHARSDASPYRIWLEDASGNQLPSYHKNGQLFVLGHFGNRYQIRVSNPTSRRVEAVVSVDGRDVLSGDVADYRRHRGYIVPAYGSVAIDGFRRSLSHVATFRFTDPGDSYSSRRGTPQHVGVIGVAIFPERRRPARPRPMIPRHYPRYDDEYRRGESSADSGRRHARSRRGRPSRSQAPAAEAAPAPKGAPSSRSLGSTGRGAGGALAESESGAPMDDMDMRAPRKNRLGTRYGEDRYSAVRETSFRRAHRSRPARLVELRYDDADGLRARGIWVHPHRYGHWDNPRPFPATNRFAPPPEGRW